VNIRELPRKVEGLSVLKATYLGWLGRYATEPGYFCVVITYGDTGGGEGGAFHVHILRALGLDKPWHRIDSYRNLGAAEANEKLQGHEGLATWTEGDKK
jgi:hypothetical protein